MKKQFAISGEILFLTIICYFVMYLVGGLWFMGTDLLLTDNFFINVLLKQSSFLIVAIAAFFLVKIYKLPFSISLHFRVFIISYLTTFSIYLIFALILSLFKVLNIQFHALSVQAIEHLILFCFFPSLFIAIGEEFLFRFFLLKKMISFLKPITAIFFSSFIFAFGHFRFEFHSFIFLFVFGIFVSIVYLKTEMLTLAISIHAAWNFAQYFLYTDSSDFSYLGIRLISVEKINQHLYDWSETILLLVLITSFALYKNKINIRTSYQ